MNEIAVEVRNLTKKYKLYASEMDRLREAFHPFRKSYHEDFYALWDVSFRVMRGEKVGIIGSNGAGKSTLLKILTGVINQTEGEVLSNGRIAALLELGAGFNKDYTGIENIRLNGDLMGLSEEEIREKMDSIIEFADIGDFIYQPVRTYSSGMFVRLAFATQIFSDPDILIVDEALSVGDIRFQQKCYRAMDELMEEKTVLLVTHDTSAVTRFCDRVIWLNQGELVYDGDVAEGLRQYKGFLIDRDIEENDESEYGSYGETLYEREGPGLWLPEVPKGMIPKGNGKASITHSAIMDDDYELLDTVEPGTMVNVVSQVVFHERTERPLYGITLFDRLGNVILSMNSEMVNLQLPPQEGTVQYGLRFRLPDLNHGEYTMSVAVANGYQEDHVQLCWLDDLLVFRVVMRQYDLPGFLYNDWGEIDITVIEAPEQELEEPAEPEEPERLEDLEEAKEPEAPEEAKEPEDFVELEEPAEPMEPERLEDLEEAKEPEEPKETEVLEETEKLEEPEVTDELEQTENNGKTKGKKRKNSRKKRGNRRNSAASTDEGNR